MWRVIWLGPAVVGIFVILMTLFVFRLEPVTFCMMTDREQEGLMHLSKIYRAKQSESVEKIEQILRGQLASLKRSTTLDASSVTFNDAVCGAKYRKSTWVGFLFNTFHQ